MAHQLLRLTETIYNTPHLITSEAFKVALDYLTERNSTSFMLPRKKTGKLVPGVAPDGSLDPDPEAAEDEDTVAGNDKDYDSNDNNSSKIMPSFGMLSVEGSLTYKPLMTECGQVGVSYKDLSESVEDMIEAGVTTIAMCIDSGGGQADGCFETASDIRQMCDDADVKLIGYVDTMACSAAYALAVVCDQLILNPSATVGSIGCVVALMDTSKAMEMAGLKQIFVTSGDNKVPFAADGSFKQEFLEQIQKDVDNLNSQFEQHVSSYSELSIADIRKMQAQVYNAKDAVAMGLATNIMTNKQFAAYAADIHKGAPYA